MSHACENCVRRSWLLGRMAGFLAVEHLRCALVSILSLDSPDLVCGLGGERADGILKELASLNARAVAQAAHDAGLAAICRHDDAFPECLRDGDGSPWMVWVAGDPSVLAGLEDPSVAVVGARRASEYGLEVATALARDLAVAGVPVVSGMALGVDSAAHRGALDGGGATIAVLASGADVPYPASKQRLYREIVARGCVVSEMPPGFRAQRWCFPARNRIIARLGRMTVVVEAADRSGSLSTARHARDLGRDVGAVPGRISSPLSRGTNALLRDGAAVVRDVQDILDELFGAGARTHAPAQLGAGLDPDLRGVLEAVALGTSTLPGLRRVLPARVDVAIVAAELELRGLLARDESGVYRTTLS